MSAVRLNRQFRRSMKFIEIHHLHVYTAHVNTFIMVFHCKFTQDDKNHA